MPNSDLPLAAIDAVVNLQTEQALSFRPSDRREFYVQNIDMFGIGP